MLTLTHWANVAQYDGERIFLLDQAGIPFGWVVNGNLHEKYQSKIRAHAVPLRIGGFHFLARRAASKLVKKIELKYGGKIMMLLVPHETTKCGWFARFVLLSDFEKPIEVIRSEMVSSRKEHDSYLSEMKECLLLALTGRIDPE